MNENKDTMNILLQISKDIASIKTEISSVKENQLKDIDIVNREVVEVKNEMDKLTSSLSSSVDKKIDELKNEFKEWKNALMGQINEKIDRLRQEFKREDVNMFDNFSKELNYVKKDCDEIKADNINLKNDISNLKQSKDKADAERWRKVIGYIITGIGGILLAQLIPFIKQLLQ